MKEYAANVPKPKVMADPTMTPLYQREFSAASASGSRQQLASQSISSSRRASLTDDLEALQSQHERDMADVHAIKRQLDLL